MTSWKHTLPCVGKGLEYGTPSRVNIYISAGSRLRSETSFERTDPFVAAAKAEVEPSKAGHARILQDGVHEKIYRAKRHGTLKHCAVPVRNMMFGIQAKRAGNDIIIMLGNPKLYRFILEAEKPFKNGPRIV